MSSDFRKQLYNNLNLKETDELVEIWQTNDRVEWTELAFDVVREILQERIGELPEQDEPIWEHDEDAYDDEMDEFELVKGPSDEENAPVFYKPRQVFWLEKWLNYVAIAAIVVVIITDLNQLPAMQRAALFYFSGNTDWNIVAWMIAVGFSAITAGLQCAIYYFPLKALGAILKILMEMEFNSRGVQSNIPNSGESL